MSVDLHWPSKVFEEWLEHNNAQPHENIEELVKRFEESLHGVFLDEFELSSTISEVACEIPDWVQNHIDWDSAVESYIDHHEMLRVDHDDLIYLFST